MGENGWPYVQHRGGPVGFLKVLDARTLGYADFSGNRQYLSPGNLDANDRVSLFLMDYTAQRRLKIWGRARVIDEDAQPELLARLESPHYRARVERGVVITVEAFDWNCPKHITPRFTEAEASARAGGGSQPEAAHMATATGPEPIGAGALELIVTGTRQLTPSVRAYELRAPDFSDLPMITAGAHLAVPVRLPAGDVVTRQYSLVTDPQRRDSYEIAVLHEPAGRGGSAAIHATWRLGTRLALDTPANKFPLHDDARLAVLVAGGIGITPIKAMAHALAARGTAFALHYSARTAADMAYRDSLASEFPGRVHLPAYERLLGAVGQLSGCPRDEDRWDHARAVRAAGIDGARPCAPPFGRPAVVQIGSPADWSSHGWRRWCHALEPISSASMACSRRMHAIAGWSCPRRQPLP